MFLWKIICLLLTVMLICTGCNNTPVGAIVRYDLAQGIVNLDPQFATEETARMLISNTMEGLFRQTAEGRVEMGMAQQYEVSDDGRTYTFYLRENGLWRNRKGNTSPVTAKDFAFALKRMLSPQTPSPFASYLQNVKNARSVLSGAMSQDALGVDVLDDYTLRITLSQPDAALPTMLSSSWAVPCSEGFFLESKARYGLELEYMQFNGPFYIRTWNNEQVISLRRNNEYYEPSAALGVDFPIPSAIAKTNTAYVTDPIERFFSGRTDACAIYDANLEGAKTMGAALTSFAGTTWMLTMQQQDPSLASADLRRAIGYSLDRSAVGEVLDSYQQPTSVLLPPTIPLGDSTYRQQAGDSSPQSYSQDLAARSIAAFGRTNTIPAALELICPEDRLHRLLSGHLQRHIQQNLGISISLVPLPMAELNKRVAAGNYQLALYSLSPAYPNPDAIFSQFTSQSESNFTSWSNPLYDSLIAEAATLPLSQQTKAFSDAEQLLLSDAVVIPLYLETTYYAAAPNVTEIVFSPFLSGLRFR